MKNMRSFFGRLCHSPIPRRAAVTLVEPPLQSTIPFVGMCKPWQLRALMLALLSLIAGCATVPPASKQARDLAISFTPLPQSAGVYLFRPSGMVGASVLWPIFLDGYPAGQVARESYLFLPVVPGNHNIAHGVSRGVSFTAEAGKNYYFIDHLAKVKPITEEEAKTYAEKFTLCRYSNASSPADYFKMMQEVQPAEDLIESGAYLLDDEGAWTDSSKAEVICKKLESMDQQFVVEAIVRMVFKARGQHSLKPMPNRRHILFLAVKLGMPGSEGRLNELLFASGNKFMAEDYLNSGSNALHDGGARWAAMHGYSIKTENGSPRVVWGQF